MKKEADVSDRKLPGHEGVWIIIFGDLLVFSLFFGTFIYYRSLNIDIYQAGQQDLNEYFGLINTLLLLTSSWFVVMALHNARLKKVKRLRKHMLAAMAFGIGFVMSKLLEYREKFVDGKSIVTDEFYTFYFMYTGIHLVHVFVGLATLYFMYRMFNDGLVTDGKIGNLESGAAFWHLVDLLWIILFAILYLVG